MIDVAVGAVHPESVVAGLDGAVLSEKPDAAEDQVFAGVFERCVIGCSGCQSRVALDRGKGVDGRVVVVVVLAIVGLEGEIFPGGGGGIEVHGQSLRVSAKVGGGEDRGEIG